MSPSRRVLVIGGARSGKSRYAQELAEASGLDALFVATAQPCDDEMRLRIARHQSERSRNWRTVEVPLALAEILERESGPDRIVLVDCLTIWLSNVMLAGDSPDAATAALVTVLRASPGPLLLVTNEVGLGVVPATPLGRAFRDAQGQLNQAVAAVCDAVVHVTAGCPRLIKPAPSFTLELG
jgi:adenosylcobinamide kinase/adenosylcobinamide-phosphate guanylyltransferase